MKRQRDEGVFNSGAGVKSGLGSDFTDLEDLNQFRKDLMARGLDG
jgi:hypothetical protein